MVFAEENQEIIKNLVLSEKKMNNGDTSLKMLLKNFN